MIICDWSKNSYSTIMFHTVPKFLPFNGWESYIKKIMWLNFFIRYTSYFFYCQLILRWNFVLFKYATIVRKCQNGSFNRDDKHFRWVKPHRYPSHLGQEIPDLTVHAHAHARTHFYTNTCTLKNLRKLKYFMGWKWEFEVIAVEK